MDAALTMQRILSAIEDSKDGMLTARGIADVIGSDARRLAPLLIGMARLGALQILPTQRSQKTYATNPDYKDHKMLDATEEAIQSEEHLRSLLGGKLTPAQRDFMRQARKSLKRRRRPESNRGDDGV